MAGKYQPRFVRNTKDPAFFKRGFAPNTANFLNKLIYHPCSIPFTVYLETLIPCFITLVLEQTVPQFDDVLVEYARGLHGGPIGAYSKGRGHFADPEARERSRSVAGKSRGLLGVVLTLDAPIEAAGYLMLAYGTVEEFFYNWGMLLSQFQHCNTPTNQGPLQRTNPTTGLVSTGTPVPLYMNILEQNRAGWGSSNALCAVPQGKYSVTLTATFKSGSNTPWYAKIGIFAALSIPLGSYESAVSTATGPDTVTCTLHTTVYFPTVTGGTIQWWYESSPIPVGIEVGSPRVSIFRYRSVLD